MIGIKRQIILQLLPGTNTISNHTTDYVSLFTADRNRSHRLPETANNLNKSGKVVIALNALMNVMCTLSIV